MITADLHFNESARSLSTDPCEISESVANSLILDATFSPITRYNHDR